MQVFASRQELESKQPSSITRNPINTLCLAKLRSARFSTMKVYLIINLTILIWYHNVSVCSYRIGKFYLTYRKIRIIVYIFQDGGSKNLVCIQNPLDQGSACACLVGETLPQPISQTCHCFHDIYLIILHPSQNV